MLRVAEAKPRAALLWPALRSVVAQVTLMGLRWMLGQSVYSRDWAPGKPNTQTERLPFYPVCPLYILKPT